MKAEGAAMVKKVGCVYRFDLTAAGGEQQSWVIDLKNGSGAVRACANTEKADCMIAMKDADFLLLMTGKLNAQQAFMKGQLKIKGNMMLAQVSWLLQFAIYVSIVIRSTSRDRLSDIAMLCFKNNVETLSQRPFCLPISLSFDIDLRSSRC